jgi:hypothetical protein
LCILVPENCARWFPNFVHHGCQKLCTLNCQKLCIVASRLHSGAIICSLIDPTGSFIFPDDDMEDEVTQKRSYFVHVLKFVGLVIGHSFFIFTWILVLINVTHESRKMRNVKTENGEIKNDLIALLRLTNVIFFNSDVKMKKQSVLARVFFTHQDLEKYKWRGPTADDDEFWEAESLTKFVLNDDTEDEYFLIEDRIKFFRDISRERWRS